MFNVLAHNRDDHTKNHAFLLDDDGEWRCTPAYDVTFSSGPGGEHALAIDGEGRQPGVEHITAVARRVGVNDKLVRACVDEVKAAVDRWPDLAVAAGVSRVSATDIDVRLNGPRPAARRRGAAVVAARERTPRRRLSR